MLTGNTSTYLVHVAPTAANLAALAGMNLKSDTPLTMDLTPQQYHSLPDRGDIRRRLVVIQEKLGVEHTYTSGSLEHALESLRQCYNEENPPVRFNAVQPPENLSLEDTLRALHVVAYCSDDEDRLAPWNSNTSVSETMAEEQLEPTAVFTDPAP